MKEFVEKLIGRLEEKVVNRTFDESIKTKNLAYKEAIEIVNQLAEEYNQNSDQDLMVVESLPSLYPMMQPFEVEAIHRVVERGKYGDGWIEKLLEAKKNCGEDSDCSKCPFGQIEDRCILNEMQIESENNGWIPFGSDQKPKEGKFYNVTIFDGEDYRTEPAYYARIGYLGQKDKKAQWWTDCTSNAELIEEDDDEVIAWQPLPEPYQPKGE